MNEEINRETFDHIVQLAALELSEEEAEYLRQQLNNQLKSIHELEAIPLEGEISPTSHGVPYTRATTPEIREDKWVPYPTPQDILAAAPEVEDGYIVVPDIPHTDLE
ncbi:MAG: Asp-tRNA(Asn)/Glu-tRNA(Gln) amidotransferase subunit GatC [Chloroflexi bacterium]|jgi:aspartyl-tRNA(Asn)/glutamyl-tRNA(Gln) amidotransferase subunit C|nr:Asp-tRNA(Asn)/Glu-tRNA(Gln) amidotransferase subunit GatC [Chloroflexota bacterium]